MIVIVVRCINQKSKLWKSIIAFLSNPRIRHIYIYFNKYKSVLCAVIFTKCLTMILLRSLWWHGCFLPKSLLRKNFILCVIWHPYWNDPRFIILCIFILINIKVCYAQLYSQNVILWLILMSLWWQACLEKASYLV